MAGTAGLVIRCKGMFFLWQSSLILDLGLRQFCFSFLSWWWWWWSLSPFWLDELTSFWVCITRCSLRRHICLSWLCSPNGRASFLFVLFPYLDFDDVGLFKFGLSDVVSNLGCEIFSIAKDLYFLSVGFDLPLLKWNTFGPIVIHNWTNLSAIYVDIFIMKMLLICKSRIRKNLDINKAFLLEFDNLDLVNALRSLDQFPREAQTLIMKYKDLLLSFLNI